MNFERLGQNVKCKVRRSHGFVGFDPHLRSAPVGFIDPLVHPVHPHDAAVDEAPDGEPADPQCIRRPREFKAHCSLYPPRALREGPGMLLLRVQSS